jgi:hypothetical protein
LQQSQRITLRGLHVRSGSAPSLTQSSVGNKACGGRNFSRGRTTLMRIDKLIMIIRARPIPDGRARPKDDAASPGTWKPQASVTFRSPDERNRYPGPIVPNPGCRLRSSGLRGQA